MKDSIRHLIQQALVRLTSEGVLPETDARDPGGKHQDRVTATSPATSP